MKITDLPFAVLRFQYKIVRAPLQLIEERLIVRMESEARGRLIYESSLAAMDVAVGNALGDSEIERRGTALAERTDALRKAAQLDAAAHAEADQAQQEFTTRRDEVNEKRTDAQNARKQAIKDARSEADERKRNTARAAQKRTADAAERADKTAAERSGAVENTKRKQQDQINAAEERAAKAAQAKAADARDKRSEAADKRSQADRVEELADVEKDKRQAAKAPNNGA